MPREIQQRRGKELGEAESLIECAGLLDLAYQRLRHRRAGLIMLGLVGEHRRLEGPVLVELRWKLDEIARHVRARERRILNA